MVQEFVCVFLDYKDLISKLVVQILECLMIEIIIANVLQLTILI
jgi:hypothetical protein